MTKPSTFIHFNVALDDDEMGMEVDQVVVAAEEVTDEPEAGPSSDVLPDYSAAKTGLTCLPQRAALLKSMLNFLKKAIQVNNLETFLQAKKCQPFLKNLLLFCPICGNLESLGCLDSSCASFKRSVCLGK